jgi:2-succinyl-5-enolpyruvyl-6-hydroxy-3-cyclohexene-1-carboxylate synthase
MGNIDRASRLIERLLAAGVREFCVCAGSRNSPLLAVLGSSGMRLFSFVDERSAAFFALGRMKAHGAPVAVVTTSGTAAAELLPAAVEAHYSGLPLILVTADRPERFRGTGAPQAIEQIGLFGVYADTELDGWRAQRPLHLNVEFDEPLIDAPVRSLEGCAPRRTPEGERVEPAVLPEHSRALVIVGGLREAQRERVREFVRNLSAPVYAEALSGLREDASLPLITAGERMIGRARFDLVIRIGSVPTLRYWRDLDAATIPVVHFTDLPFAGMARGAIHPIEALPDLHGERDEGFFSRDRGQAAAFHRLLDDEPDSELAMLRTLSHDLAPGTQVYLGNSLPIREWDLAATRETKAFAYEGNRGANGIDGQLSAFLGWCSPERDNVCVLGDLTALYDLNAPWIVPQLGHTRFRIVIVNNGGGRIFSRVTSLRGLDSNVRERIIENAHELRFEHWAKMWDIDVTELRPDTEASRRVWERYDALWA